MNETGYTNEKWRLPDGINEHQDAYYCDPSPDPKRKDQTPASPVSSGLWKALVDALSRYRPKLLRIPGVTAVDIGYKMKDGKYTDTLALRVHVERKLPPDVFKNRPGDLIPKEPDKAKPEQRYLYADDTPVEMDVIEANYKLVAEGTRRPAFETPLERDRVNRRRRVDPLVGGVSIGSPQVPVGTLGALVWDRETGNICILSNWHVLAGNLRAEVGTPCLQPGLFDQGRSTDVIAHLKSWSLNRQTDAAIAELNGSRRYSTGEILGMFQTIKEVAHFPYIGMIVHKSGRSSGHSWGFIDGLYFSAAIEYSSGFMRVFEEQIHIAPLKDQMISEPGDSGSVWVANAPDEGYLAVGLHFAGDLPHSSFGEYALANPMSVVARRLNFSFRPLFYEVRDEDLVSPTPPSAPQSMKIEISNANGTQPMSIVLNAPSGSGGGGQPVDDRFGPGGTG